MMEPILPAEFSQLEPFVDRWAVATMAGRLRLRIESSAEDRRQFYEAILPAAEQALEYLGQFSLDELPPEASRLLQLMLSLAEISLTQEVYTPEVEAVHARSNRLIRVQRSSTVAETCSIGPGSACPWTKTDL